VKLAHRVVSPVMINQQQLALNDASEWLGDWHPLAEQLGSASGLLALGSVARFLRLPDVQDIPSLKRFLSTYQTRVLARFELPAIYASQQHAERNELRELIELDRTLADQPILKLFAGASRRIGQWQLQKLRPLRDQRIVQRYLSAVEAGEADGWHTLVYGLTLAVYSLPSRQGLAGYAHQVTRGQIYMAARELRLSEKDCRDLFEEFSSGFQRMIEDLISEGSAEVADQLTS
jgi:urease accessory protein UreF